MITTIPFTVLSIDNEGFHLMIKTYINKKVAHLVIDTGASKTVFDVSRLKKYVSEKSFVTHDKLSTGLGTNSMESQLVTLKKFKIGELEIQNYQTVLLDLSHVNNSYQQVGLKQIDGVLGSDILLNHKAIIDYNKKLLKLNFSKIKK